MSRHIPLVIALVLALFSLPAAAGTFEAAPLVPAAGVDVVHRGVARERLDRDLFSDPFATVVLARVDLYDVFPYLEARAFQIVSDPGWNRILAGELDHGLVAYDGQGTTTGPLREPRGLALGAGGTLYVADSGNDRVVVLVASSTFDRLTLAPIGELGDLSRPYGLAYSDRGTPQDPADDRLYVTEAGANRVTSFAVGERSARLVDRVGELGSGPGRFGGPLAVAVRGDDIVVADAHNSRLVVLRETDGRLRWTGEAKHDAGALTTLDVDRWGNLYGTGPQSNQVVKFSPDLQIVDRVSSLDGPRGFHVPVSDVTDHRSGTVSRSREARAISLERWTGESGFRLWNLGVDVRDLAVRLDRGVNAEFLLTDRAQVTASIVDGTTGETRLTVDAGILDAGARTLRFSDQPLPGGSYRAIIDARSTYETQPVDRAVVPFTVAGAPAASRPVLLGATPNPFQAQTRIHFNIPEAEHTRLRIFDLEGRLVRTLADEVRGPGAVEITWDGRDGAGVTVGAGIYFYQLAAGREKLTAKLIRVQ